MLSGIVATPDPSARNHKIAADTALGTYSGVGLKPTAVASLESLPIGSQQPNSFLMHPAALDAFTHTAAALSNKAVDSGVFFFWSSGCLPDIDIWCGYSSAYGDG